MYLDLSHCLRGMDILFEMYHKNPTIAKDRLMCVGYLCLVLHARRILARISYDITSHRDIVAMPLVVQCCWP